MKRKTILSAITGAALLLLTAGCTNNDAAQDDNKQNPEPGTEGLTAFVIEDNDQATKGTATRTTAEYDGSGLNFFWTPGDRLWVNRATSGTPDWKQDKKNNIDGKSVDGPVLYYSARRAAKASFFFDGNFTANEYKVRYTGQNGTADKVTIAATQEQEFPGVPDHFAASGDCGVATAKRRSDKSYSFMLDHKAAYITFMPYSRQAVLNTTDLLSIKVTADKAICGQFDFNDNGIDTLSRPAATDANKSITISFGNHPYKIPYTVTPALIMVIAPGTYSKITVEYTVQGPNARKGVISKTYTNVTFTAGKNKKISQKLAVTEYTPKYYLWDAGRDYFGGRPPQYNESYGNDPKDNSDTRWYNEMEGYRDYTGNAPAVNAQNSCRYCPNVNEGLWYAQYGDPHWDKQQLWAMYGGLFTGGMWVKKQSAIVADNPGLLSSVQQMKDKAPDGTNYARVTSHTGYINHSVTQGRPEKIGDYFFLPTFGIAGGGTYGATNNGYYWLSTPVSVNGGYDLQVFPGKISVQVYNRTQARPIFNRGNEDKYRPNGL